MSASLFSDLQAVYRQHSRSVDLIVLGCLIAAAVLLRTIYTGPVELDGDALLKWSFVKDVYHGVPVARLLDDHHTARWAVNLPSLFFVLLFGAKWSTYYLIPIVYFAIFLVLSAWLIAWLHPRRLFVFVVFLLVLFGEPATFRSTSQLQPFIFVATYMVAHAIFLLRSVSNPTQFNFFWAAFFIFLAYGAKETALFFVPASALFVLLRLGWREGTRTLLFIGLYGLVLVALETAVFTVIKGELTTRIDLVSTHFTGLEQRHVLESFWNLFDGWIRLPAYSLVLNGAALVASVILIVRARRLGNVPNHLLPIFLFLAFAFFQTFTITSIDPVVPIAPPRAGKYLANLIPWASLIVAVALGVLADSEASPARRLRGMATTLVAVAAICLVSLTTPGQYNGGYPFPGAWFWHADQTYRFVKRQMQQGVPLARKARKLSSLRRVLGIKLAVVGDTMVVDLKFREANEDELAVKDCLYISRKLAFKECPAFSPYEDQDG